MWWLSAAMAGFFEPAANINTVDMELSGQTYANKGFLISGARFGIDVGHQRWAGGLHLRMLDDPYTDESWDLHALNVWMGYRVVDHPRFQLMPYVRGGTHFQVGLSLALNVPVGPGSFEVDASGGPLWSLGSSWVARPIKGIPSAPGLPEVGVGYRFDSKLQPALRVGMVGTQLVGSAELGFAVQELPARFYFRAALGRDLLAPRGFGTIGVGFRM